jgi:outer membrane receptor protein involved in Fe transport
MQATKTNLAQRTRFPWALAALCAAAVPVMGQQTTPAPVAPVAEEEVLELSPFEVTAEDNESYAGATTLAGNRLNTELRDVGNAIQVVTAQFLADTGAVNNETLLQYTTSTEVGNYLGNFTGLGDGAQLNETARFQNPNSNTRVRGLTAADNTRDYFLTDIPWDGYNIDRVDLSRGPNSILFGQGSPAGIINAGIKAAGFRDGGAIDVRFASEGSIRGSFDYNKVILDNQLAIRINALYDAENFKQKPAYEDDRRVAAAFRYEPGFLKKGSARTILKGNFESGDIKSNRPRSLPPGDYISPWFYTGTYLGRYNGNAQLAPGIPTAGNNTPRVFQNLNKMTVKNPHVAQNDNFYDPTFAHGFTRPVIANGPSSGMFNPYYNPWIGNFAQAIGGAVGTFVDNGTAVPTYINQEIREDWGINTSGARDGGLGYDFNRQVGINQYSSFAQNAKLPLSEFGVYKNLVMTDPSIFDFYNNLIDGPNKNEWQDFEVYNISLSQTFFNDKVGFDLSYNREDYRRGQISLITDWRQAIYVDINERFGDGTAARTGGVPYNDGTVNPNLGRPFISDNGTGGNNWYESERESKRVTGYVSHDFNGGDRQNWLTRTLGKHTLTGLWAQDDQDTETRSWIRWANVDPAYRDMMRSTANFNEGQTFIPSQVIYLGPSLMSASSAAGANISRPMVTTTMPSGTTRFFDSHWANRPGVDPAAPWQNTMYPSTQTAQYNSTQSENPLNYVGWVNLPYNVTDSEASAANRDLLSTNAAMEKTEITSQVLVWQGDLLDGGLVGTYGIRKDKVKGWQRSINTNTNVLGADAPTVDPTREFGYLRLDPAYFFLPATPSEFEETSESWSVVAHFDELPFLKKATANWPIHISASYSESENFQPAALRVNLYGEALQLPSGATKDASLLLETRDGKYSFRITKFKTEAKNASSSALQNAGFIGTIMARGTNWANQFQYDFGTGNQPSNHQINAQVNGRPAGAPQPPGWTEQVRPGNPTWDPTNSLYNFGTGAGETQAQADIREANAIAGWRALQNSIDPRFWTAWSMDLAAPFRQTGANGLNSSQPQGFTVTEDSTSEGYEFEFSAQPTKNWRIAVNASKIEAVRQNIGGQELSSFIQNLETALQTTGAGDIRIWWGTAGNETTLYQWYGPEGAGGSWASRKLQEGTRVPELREWRFNLITNYTFTEGKLNGFNVGGGIRYQSEVGIGYEPIPGATPNSLSYDLSNPYMGPAETNFDLWASYTRKISSKVEWQIQLNVRNFLQDDELIPITTQPDGSAAAYRIAPPEIWTLSNTFRF